MVFDEGLELGSLQRLPALVRKVVSPNGSLGLRVPAHSVATKLLERCPGPLVLSSANRSGEPEATSAQQIADQLGDGVAVILDAGAPRYGQASTVIRVKGNQFDVLREGVLPADALRRLAARVILFVCTGNTCRSPLAEGLCKKLLAESLQCRLEELPERGYVVLSAGTSAASGYPASPEGVVTAEQRGVDLSSHQSRLLTRHLLSQADDVFAMTHSHLRALRSLGVADAGRHQVLSPDGSDLADPIGCEQALYDNCADQIEAWLRQRLPSLLT
jgi:protein-tyrosine phosphatase